jgi:hypothetical protein
MLSGKLINNLRDTCSLLSPTPNILALGLVLTTNVQFYKF